MAANLTIYIEKFPNFEAALKKFKKRVDKLGIISEYLTHEYFESKSHQRHRQRRASERRRRQQPLTTRR